MLPTGKETQGLGSGVTIVEPFVVVRPDAPGDGFVQVQAGVELSLREPPARGVLARGVRKTFEQDRFGRAWSPMVEVAWRPRTRSGRGAHWDLVPQVQVSLSRRQHILVSGGVRIPLNEREVNATRRC